MKAITQVFEVKIINKAAIDIVNDKIYAIGIELDDSSVRTLITDLHNIHILSLKKARTLFEYKNEHPLSEEMGNKIFDELENMGIILHNDKRSNDFYKYTPIRPKHDPYFDWSKKYLENVVKNSEYFDRKILGTKKILK